MLYPPIAIVGESGFGKSYSIRNLPSKETVIINADQKFLPLKNASEFKDNNIYIKEEPGTPFIIKYAQEIDKAAKNKDIKFIVIDSFYFYIEELMARARILNKGYEIFNFYNEKIYNFFTYLKSIENKWIIVIASPETLQLNNPDGTSFYQKRIYVQGKKYEGKIEHHFTIVLFCDISQPDKSKAAEYSFLTNSDGMNTAKSPAGMFSERKIPNDLLYVCKQATKHWGLEPISESLK